VSRLKSCRALADTFHMPIYVAMAYPQEPESPSPDASRAPEAEPMNPETAPGSSPGEAGLTAEQLAKVLRRLETGFYDAAEVREQIARRILDELDQ
jgi:hypothetical protein